MRTIFLTLFFLLTSLYGSTTNIDKKIVKTSSKLHSYKKNYVSINKKLNQTADAIFKQKKELNQQIVYLEKLKAELLGKESSYKENTKKLKLLKKSQEALKEKQDKIEEKLVFFIAKSVSLSIVLEEKYAQNSDSLIQIEVLKKMLKASRDEAKKLNATFYENEKSIELLKSDANTLQSSINNIDQKRKKLIKITNENKRALIKLQKEKAAYTKQLKSLIKRQNALKNTLDKLNIIKRDAIKREQERKEREAAFARNKKINLNENLPKVKQHGNSYQSVKTIRYRGPKTIAPLSSYTITKKYGPYTDPIYGIKIFNESISLRPKQANAKVRNVMNGKVVYADNTAVLHNMVIVEHKNGLHTIYANLTKIAPNIRKDKKIRKGAIIGRVKDELMFEVTQKKYHINPIQLFR